MVCCIFLLYFQVFNCFRQYFCLHFEAFQLDMAPTYMAFFRFMGNETEARNFSYSHEAHDGLIIQRNMALFFSGSDRKELKLRVTSQIWKEQQNPDARGGHHRYTRIFPV